MSKLFFGTAGVPLSTNPASASEILTVAGIRRLTELRLGAMEVEFVRRVYITARTAPQVATTQKETGILLSAHAPYFINLNAFEEAKLKLSRAYIYNAAKALYACGGTDVIFHAGFYMECDAEETYKNIREQIFLIEKKLATENIKVRLRPEISGKPSAFGNVTEIINLSADLKTVWPCIDFSHAYARTCGQFNSYEDFCSIMHQMKEHLGEKSVTEYLHAHVSGITFTDKGEKSHLTFAQSGFNVEALVCALRDMHAGGRIICESNNLETDALFLQQSYEHFSNL